MKGNVTNIDTSEWKVGQRLYLSPDKPGELTTKKFGDSIFEVVKKGY